jgi:hypothetical protein
MRRGMPRELIDACHLCLVRHHRIREVVSGLISCGIGISEAQMLYMFQSGPHKTEMQ